MTAEPWTPPPTHELTTADGRVVAYCLYGPRGGRPRLAARGAETLALAAAEGREYEGGHEPADGDLRRILAWLAHPRTVTGPARLPP